ncbi:MAG: outer membrane beta-barrel protein [Mucilaginibacter sp.]|uniref:outer membrane beta-barrel protein n=1 Tax=Mucilaginibacter sp. TaxID=1882438 RepID=UPI0032670B9A
MIKNLLLLFVAILLTGNLFAQIRGNRMQGQTATPAPPVLFREISGVIRDTTDNTLIGATILLTSRLDTLRTVSNNDGIFVFKNVKMATFTLTITEVGYITSVRKYLQNDAVKRLVLEPIILKSSSHMMNEVKINGTPSITYKIDTVEYKASDYKVRDNATVDELLKKMEGFEVGTDGTVTHQGQAITKAKLNGTLYSGGDVAQAIQNLPAEIVEKIQVVDDYGDAAARTGVKDGDPQKVLNITTKPDRSIGLTGRLNGQYGSDDRYNVGLTGTRINANQQIAVNGTLNNTVTGVSSSGITGGATVGGGGGNGISAGGGGSPGTNRSGSPSFGYNDQFGKNVKVESGYRYKFNDNNSTSNSFGRSNSTLGYTNFTRSGTSESDSKSHNVNFDIKWDINKSNFLQITPSFSYSSSNSSSTTDNQTDAYYTRIDPVTGAPIPNYQFYNTIGSSGTTNSTTNYGLTAFYQHIFEKPKRNVSLQVSITSADNESEKESKNNIYYFTDTTRTVPKNQLLNQTRVDRNSNNKTYRASSTYVEPLGLYSQLELNAQIRTSTYDNSAVNDSIAPSGQIVPLSYRDNIYNYTFTESHLTLNYRFSGIKYNISLGTTAVPTYLSGTKLNAGAGANVSTGRSDFRLIPVFRFAYSWSRTQRFSFYYSGSNTEPSFQEIQPFTDISNPRSQIVGNPNLKPAFTHSFNAQYNNYLANSKLNFSFFVNASIPVNQISTNVIQVLGSPYATNGDYINETHYVNLNGSQSVTGRYNIAKQLDDRKYNLSLNGNVTYNYNQAVSNDVQYHTTNWRFDERFGPRITPAEWIEINPYIGYDLSRSFSSLVPNSTSGSTASSSSLSTQVQKTSLAVDGKIYFLKSFQFNYNAAKSYVAGLGSLSTNPLVINMGLEKDFFKKRTLVITFNAYDILHQNNFIEQTLSPNGSFTNTLSSSLSRYFLVGARLYLQKWSGTPTRNGKKMNRRGDGSFIYE